MVSQESAECILFISIYFSCQENFGGWIQPLLLPLETAPHSPCQNPRQFPAQLLSHPFILPVGGECNGEWDFPNAPPDRGISSANGGVMVGRKPYFELGTK